ncbi:MAG TPA: hypothetical protein VGG72_34115 [Bryobacteraceae bacterium]|jgi:hypothetical protein
MKSLLCCFLLVTAGLSAQSTGKLDADLMTHAAAQQVTDDILALAEKDAQPSRQVVSDFAEDLTKALMGKQMTAEKAKAIRAAIEEVLESSGAASYRFHASIDRFRDSLIAVNATAVQAKAAAGRLLILGQDVRGPEDIPVRPLQLLRLK